MLTSVADSERLAAMAGVQSESGLLDGDPPEVAMT
jgi:hypothetical protein